MNLAGNLSLALTARPLAIGSPAPPSPTAGQPIGLLLILTKAS